MFRNSQVVCLEKVLHSKKAGCKVIYLPPYSPDLNPIEHVWANLKRLIRKHPKKEQNLAEDISDSMGCLFIG